MDSVLDFLNRINTDAGFRHEVQMTTLIVGMLFASVHLVTMFVTRWGDQRATSKSLIFSIILHVACGTGIWATMKDVKSEPVVEKKKKPPKPPPTLVVRFDGIDTFETKKAGNTPLFRKLPPTKQLAMTRRETLPHSLQNLPQPKRRANKPDQPRLDDPNIRSNPNLPAAMPKVEHGPRGPFAKQSVTPNRIRDEAAIKRPQPSNPSPKQVKRIPINRPAQTRDKVLREMSQGAVDETSNRLNLDNRIAMLDSRKNRISPFKTGKKKPIIRKRRSPLRSSADSNNTGVNARRITKGTAGNNPQPKRIVAMRSRVDDGAPNGGSQRYKPNLSPKSTQRTPSRILASRRRPAIKSLRNGPRPNVLRSRSRIPARRSSNLPATYRLRSLANRKATAEKHGGTDASERAVEAALKWLAANQNAAGYWDADAYGSGKVKTDENGVDRRYAGRNADTGLTALSLLAFLGAGYTHEEGPYSKTVDKAIRWLISQQRSDGFLGGKATHYAKMYCHGMATYALAEAYGMQTDPTVDTRIRGPLKRAIAYILANQNPDDGGWRYIKGQRSDLSMFGWQLMALKSAEIAGLTVPRDSKVKMVKFLKALSFGKNKGLASYQKGYKITATMTAESLFCKQMFRIPREHPACKEAVGYMLARLPRRAKLNLYYWYYGTLAMYQYGGPEWKKWNDAVRSALVAEQITRGKNAGSWDPKGPWGPYGGRVFSTAVSALCLEVYYRFLPLYQMSGKERVQ